MKIKSKNRENWKMLKELQPPPHGERGSQKLAYHKYQFVLKSL